MLPVAVSVLAAERRLEGCRQASNWPSGALEPESRRSCATYPPRISPTGGAAQPSKRIRLGWAAVSGVSCGAFVRRKKPIRVSYASGDQGRSTYRSAIPARSTAPRPRAVRRTALARARSRLAWGLRFMPRIRTTVEDDPSTRTAVARCERPASFHNLPGTDSRGNGGATSYGADDAGGHL